MAYAGCSRPAPINSDIPKESTSSNAKNAFPDIFPVIILQAKEGNTQKGFMPPSIGLAFINSDGEYLLFDNDGDYTSLCRDARIVGNICHEMLSELQRKDIGKKQDAQYWDTIIIPMLKVLPEYARQYFYGDKNAVSMDIYELIDRYNYDRHPLELEYSLRKSGYNEKVYGSPYTFFSLNNYINLVFVPAKKLRNTLKATKR
ncbi:MAG: hypothetical protein NC248_01115 [Bacteroides sp.]|nr:hypothetical protein [Bacteroides sp.]